MEDGKQAVVLRCDLRERTSFGKSHGEGLIDDDIFPSAQGSGSERKMAFIGTGDDYEIDVPMCRHFLNGTDDDSGTVSLQNLSLGGPDHAQHKTWHRMNKGGMEGLSGKAVA